MYIILLIVVVALAALVFAIARQPDEFKITRTASFAVPPEILFAQVNDLHKWNDWSPWAKLDPNVKNTFTGPDSGSGAHFEWSGNNKVGAGKMTVTESKPNDLVRMRLEFLKPFKAVNTVEFTFVPEGGKTQMSWSMYGPKLLMNKIMSLVMDCDKMAGGQFEQGFANLRTIVEK